MTKWVNKQYQVNGKSFFQLMLITSLILFIHYVLGSLLSCPLVLGMSSLNASLSHSVLIHKQACARYIVGSSWKGFFNWIESYEVGCFFFRFVLLWVLWCPIRCELWVKAFPHLLHAYGRSPVWVLWCLMRWELWRKAFPQSWHL